jgi:curved DNA-binding protein CbpA
MERSQPGSSRDDPYSVLGVGIDASRREISRAYRRAVHGTHPDARPHDPLARARFEALTDAYDLLSDPARRAEHDRRHLYADPPGPPADSAVVTLPDHPVIWAAPVHIAAAPPRPSRTGDRTSPAERFEDPPVFLGQPALSPWRWAG